MAQTQLKLVLKDFKNFLYIVWKHLDLPAPTPLQYEIADYLQHGDRRIMIQAFRGIGKSWICAAFVLWILLKDPQLKILVVSASADRSESFANFVKQLIHTMPILAHLAANNDQRDSMVSFDVGPSLPAQSPSVKAAGITGQITGSRADIIIADDVEIPKNSLTQLMRDRLSEAIKEFDAILTTQRDKNRIIYLGTPQTEMSVYQHLPSRGFTTRTWTARVPEGDQLKRMRLSLAPSIVARADAGEVLTACDTRFDDVDLTEREASYGRSGFALQFMLDTNLSDADRYPLKLSDLVVHDSDALQAPVRIIWGSGPEQVINELDAVGLTGDRWHRPIKVSDDWANYSGAVMFIDPSGRGADETSCAVVKYAHGMLHLTKVAGFKDGYSPDTLKGLASIAKTQNVKLIMIEPNYGGGMFTELFKPILLETGHNCGVEESPWAKGQKELRIIDTLEPILNQHRLAVARTVVEDDLVVAKKDQQYSLFYQLTRITKERGAIRHDDRLEAVAGAVYYWVESMARDMEKVEDNHRDKLQDAELKKFKKGLFVRPVNNGVKPKRKSLLRTRR